MARLTLTANGAYFDRQENITAVRERVLDPRKVERNGTVSIQPSADKTQLVIEGDFNLKQARKALKARGFWPESRMT